MMSFSHCWESSQFPAAVMIVVSIINGDISFIDEEMNAMVIEEE